MILVIGRSELWLEGKVLVPRPEVLTTGPQRPAVRALSPSFMPALSRKNSGEEVEGKEKGKRLLKKKSTCGKMHGTQRERHLWEV